MEIVLLCAVLVIPLVLNVWATSLVVRDALSERRQKVAQLLLTWLLPIIGAVIVLAVHRPAEAPSRKYREMSDAGEDFAVSGRSLKGLREMVDGDD